jgi:succinyl-diaminopimelate desuccinylase
MKTSLAALVVATEEFLAAQPETPLNIAFLLTSDEEGPAVDGTVVVCEACAARRACPTTASSASPPPSAHRRHDQERAPRHHERQAHGQGCSGPHRLPAPRPQPDPPACPALAELVAVEWDGGNTFFPPTTWQVSNIHGGTGASNIIPGHVVVDFNFRFSTESTPHSLQQRLTEVLRRHGLDFELAWTVGGLPFLTTPGDAGRCGADGHSGRNRNRDPALHHRRHQ